MDQEPVRGQPTAIGPSGTTVTQPPTVTRPPASVETSPTSAFSPGEIKQILALAEAYG